MLYPIIIKGFENQTIEVESAGFVAAAKLLVNGQPAPKGKKRGQMLLRRDDGVEVVATWKGQLMDVPRLVIDGQVINVVEPLKWYQWVWSAFPIILVFIGGALGGIVGVIAASINLKIFRSEMNVALQYGATAVVSVLAAIVYFVLALIFVVIIGN